MITKILVSLLISYLILATLGCRQTYKDVSDSSEYAGILTHKFELLQDLAVHGVTTDKDYAEKIDYYTITSKPGFSGPEVITKETLKTGTIIEVERVIKCEISIFSTEVFVIITIPSDKFHFDKELRLTGLSVITEAGKIGMDPKYFRQIQSSQSLK